LNAANKSNTLIYKPVGWNMSECQSSALDHRGTRTLAVGGHCPLTPSAIVTDGHRTA